MQTHIARKHPLVPGGVTVVVQCGITVVARLAHVKALFGGFGPGDRAPGDGVGPRGLGLEGVALTQFFADVT